jgi:chromosome segregation ATPase
MSDTKALEKYLAISLHTTAWNEMSLLQQALLNDQAAAELAEINKKLDNSTTSFTAIFNENIQLKIDNDQLRAELDNLIAENIATEIAYTQVRDTLDRFATTLEGFATDHAELWKDNIDLTEQLAQLRTALEKKETLIVKLKNTLVMDNNNRPARLWDLLSALEEARLLIAFLAGYMSVSSGAVEKSKHDEAVAWLNTNKSQGDSDVSS